MHRYLVYVESNAWATNLKQKLACGSVVLAIRPRYFEFFSRALRAGVHYIEVQPATGPGPAFSGMCTDLARQVSLANNCQGIWSYFGLLRRTVPQVAQAFPSS